jgi:hypothetical protein
MPKRSLIRIFNRILIRILPERISFRLRYIGLDNVIRYAFMQRILRINSHVPWPVHWSSAVIAPDKIVLKDRRPYPGYMPGQYIQAVNGIEFGSNVRLGPGVKIISASHDINDFAKHSPARPIRIGDNCWLSTNVVVLPGVQLGNHVVAAAGAVVTKDVADNRLVAGVPAVVIKELPPYQGDMNSVYTPALTP